MNLLYLLGDFDDAYATSQVCTELNLHSYCNTYIFIILSSPKLFSYIISNSGVLLI